MKQLFLTFFLIAVASASISSKMFSLFGTIADVYEEGRDVHFDVEKFLVGLNNGLNIASTEEVAICLITVLPTVQTLGQELENIVDLHWDHAFNLLDDMKFFAGLFQTNCQGVHTAFLNHFAGAIAAFKQDRKAFLKQVVANLRQNEVESINAAVTLVTDILENDDTVAGEALGDLINLALSSYLPTTTNQVVF